MIPMKKATFKDFIASLVTIMSYAPSNSTPTAPALCSSWWTSRSRSRLRGRAGGLHVMTAVGVVAVLVTIRASVPPRLMFMGMLFWSKRRLYLLSKMKFLPNILFRVLQNLLLIHRDASHLLDLTTTWAQTRCPSRSCYVTSSLPPCNRLFRNS